MKRGHREPFIGPLEPGTKMIPVGPELFAKVDEADYWRLAGHIWMISWNGYAIRKTRKHEGIRKSKLYMHRVIMQTPDGLDTDHRSGDRLDNRRVNLRVCTRQQNMHNLSPTIQRSDSSPYKGVGRTKNGRAWVARIRHAGRMLFIGTYADPIAAARAYDTAAVMLRGDFARTNFPREEYA